MSEIDPILLSVYARTFKSITDEMSMSVQQQRAHRYCAKRKIL